MSRGIGFPFTISGKYGRVESSGDRDNIRESVRIILLTEPGERIMNPRFGTRLHQFLFEVTDARLKELVKRECVSSLMRWEQRIEEIEVAVKCDEVQEGTLSIEVSYRVTENGEEDKVAVRV